MRDMVTHPDDKLSCGVNTAQFTGSSSGDLALIDTLLPGFSIAILKSVKGGSLQRKYPRFRGLYLDDIE